MKDIFITLLNMSISATWLIAAVVLVRLCMGKAPKWIRGVLWGMVALRLVVPFAIESPVSLVPDLQISVETSEESALPAIDVTEEVKNPEQAVIPPVVDIPVVTPSENSPVVDIPSPEILPTSPGATVGEILLPDEPVLEPEVQTPVITPDQEPEVEKGVDLGFILAIIWVVGAIAMAAYCVGSYLRLKIRLREAVLVEDGVYESEWIKSAFVLGIIKPIIYIPRALPKADREYVIAHERVHISRFDYILKPLGFLILALHWFNPTVWLAYLLYCRDIELACDEKVIKGYTVDQVKGYSRALVACGEGHSRILVCPIAFGEVGIKERVKNILNYKKPAFWIVVGAVALCIIVAICFMTVRGDKETGPSVDSTEQTDGTEDTDGTEGAENTEPTGEADPTEPDSSKSTDEPTDPSDPTDSTNPTKPDVVPPETPDKPIDPEDKDFVHPRYKYYAKDSLLSGEEVSIKDIIEVDGVPDLGIEDFGCGYRVYVESDVHNTSEVGVNTKGLPFGFEFIFTHEELIHALGKVSIYENGVHPFELLYEYNEQDFERYVLVIIDRPFPGEVLPFSVAKVIKNGSELCFNIKTDIYREGKSYSSDFGQKIKVYELEKQALDGIDTVSLYVEDKDPPYSDDLPITFDEPKYDYIPCYTRPNGTAMQFNTVYMNTSGSSAPFGKPTGVTTEIQCTDEPLDIYRRCYMGFDFIYTYEELQTAIKEYKADKGNNVDLSAFERFDEEYFEEHVLVSTYRVFSSGSLKYSVSGIFKNGRELAFYITTDMYRSNGDYAYITLVADSVMVLEMSRSALDGVDTVSLYAEDVNGNTVEPPRGDTERLTFDVANSETMPEGESVGYSVELNTDAEVPNWLKWDSTVVGTIDEYTSCLYVRMNHRTLTGSGESVSQALKNINCAEYAEMAEKYDAEYFKDKVLFLLCQDTAKRRINITSVVKSGNDLYIRVSVNRNIIVQEKNVILLELDRDVVKTVDTVYYYAESSNEHYCAGDHLIAPATCTESAYCMLCGKDQGKPLGHGEIIDAGCTTNGVCSRCGIVVENTAEHDLSNNICQRSGCGERGVIYDNVVYGEVRSSYTKYELGQLDCEIAIERKYRLSGTGEKKYAEITIWRDSDYVHWEMSRVRGYVDGVLTDLGNVKLSDDRKSIIIPLTGEGEYLVDICYGDSAMPYTTTISLVVDDLDIHY